MKNTLTLSILLLAGSANAQYRPIFPSLPDAHNPVLRLPTTLPGPLSGPLAGARISLPTPTVTPSLSLAGVCLPVVKVPAAPITARRENVVNPAGHVLPTIRVQFAARAERTEEPQDAVDQNAEKDNLDRLFDGELPTHRPDRRINIPEREMERELGF